MADEDKIVQTVDLEGADDTTSKFEQIGDAAEKAFTQMGDAADKASASLEALSDKADSVSKSVKSSTDGVAGGATSFGKISTAASDFGSALTEVGSRVSSFVTRLGTIGAVVPLSIGGLVAAAASAKAAINATSQSTTVAEQTSRSFSLQLRTQQRETTNLKLTQISNDRALSDLTHQFAIGKLTAEDYTTQVQELRRTQSNAADDARKVAAIEREAIRQRISDQEDFAKSQAKAEAARAKNAALDQLDAQFGNQLTNSLLKLSDVTDKTKKSFLDAFGPEVAKFVDDLSDQLQKNSGVISKFFDESAKEAGSSLKEVSSGSESFISGIAEFAKSVGDIIKNVVIPAIRGLIALLNIVAEAINGIFGTKLSASTILAAAAIARFSGALGLVTSLIPLITSGVRLLTAAFGPWGVAIGLVVTALGFLATKVDWKRLIDDAGTAAAGVIKFFQDLPGRIGGFFVELWNSAKKLASDAWDAIVAFGSDAVDKIVAVFNSVVKFFSDVWSSISKGASDAWDSVSATFKNAGDIARQTWSDVSGFFKDTWNGIKQGALDAWDGIKQAFVDTGSAVKAAYDGVLQFFRDGWDAIKTGAADAWSSVKQGAQDAFDSLIRFIQPAIDKAKELWSWLKQAFSQAGDLASAPQGPGFAGGGYVRGPGTTTSDGIVARLSNKEFVHRARAVAHYGVRAMHLINNMQIPVANLSGFANGGLVDINAMAMPSGAPRFSDGGMVRSGISGQAVILNIGEDTFNLVTREVDTAARLGRYAQKRRQSSAGKKASYFGNGQ